MTAISWKFNVLVITYRGGVREVLRELRELGRFKASTFRDVVIGRAENLEIFFEKVEEKLKDKPFLPLSRVIPLDKVFKFNLKTLIDDLKRFVSQYLKEFSSSESFCVRVERRGFKGMLSSREIEVEIGRYVQIESENVLGRKLRVDLKNPDKVILVEVIGGVTGISIVRPDDILSITLLKRKHEF